LWPRACSAEQAKIARQTYRDYGRGSGHPAGLNFGDCFSYALAREKREPVLWKGDDFGHTDFGRRFTRSQQRDLGHPPRFMGGCGPAARSSR